MIKQISDCKIKATVVYRCSKVINLWRENKFGLINKKEGNTSTSTIRGKQRHINQKH